MNLHRLAANCGRRDSRFSRLKENVDEILFDVGFEQIDWKPDIWLRSRDWSITIPHNAVKIRDDDDIVERRS